MKRARRWAVLLGAVTMVGSVPGAHVAPNPVTAEVNLKAAYLINPDLLMAASQSATNPPQSPPAGPPVAGEPIENRPNPPRVSPDFQAAPPEKRAGRRKVNAAEAIQDAQALSDLARKVQNEVGQLSKNVYPKDLNLNLKQIQKLSKRLRGEVSP